MKSFVRNTMLATALILAANTVEAQERRQKELRIDLAGVGSVDGNTILNVGLPGTVALGIYLNQKIAIEPTLSFTSVSGDVSFTDLTVGVWVPYYLKGDGGRSGLFISPGIEFGKMGGDFDSDGTTDFGVDVGIKKTMRENVVMRIAGNLRTGDNYQNADGDSVIGFGATFGLGIFWK